MADYNKNENDWTEFKTMNNYNKYNLLKKIGKGCAIGTLIAAGFLYGENKNKDNKEVIGHEINLKKLIGNQIKPNQIEIYNTPIDFTKLNSKQNYLEVNLSNGERLPLTYSQILDVDANKNNYIEQHEADLYKKHIIDSDSIENTIEQRKNNKEENEFYKFLRTPGTQGLKDEKTELDKNLHYSLFKLAVLEQEKDSEITFLNSLEKILGKILLDQKAYKEYLEDSKNFYGLNQNLLNVLENSEETSYLHYLKNTDRINEVEFLTKLNNLKEEK